MKFSVAHPNPGKRSAENFTKISRQISRHLWQRKTEKNFTSALLQDSCSEFYWGGVAERILFSGSKKRLSLFPDIVVILKAFETSALSATFILSKNSGVLEAKSRLKLANPGQSRLISANLGSNLAKIRPKVD